MSGAPCRNVRRAPGAPAASLVVAGPHRDNSALDPEPDLVGTKKNGVAPTIKIHLEDHSELTSDAHQWILRHNGRYTYHRDLESAFQELFQSKLRASTASTLQELADAVISAKMEIMDALRPFCVWTDQGIHFLIHKDFKSSVSE